MKCELIDLMGDDLRVVNAARVSFNKESNYILKGYYTGPDEGEFDVDYYGEKLSLVEKDEKLIKYLANHNHFTPFTHCFITMRETVPIFIARQRFKHTVGFTYNEISRRYVDDPPEFYIPTEWRARPEGGIKQGSSDKKIKKIKGSIISSPFKHLTEKSYLVEIGRSEVGYYSVDKDYKYFLDVCENFYNHLIQGGVAPEQARMVLPQSTYTSYYVSGSLAAWARAYKLRSEETAQREIQELASQWDQIIRPHFPVSWSALVD